MKIRTRTLCAAFGVCAMAFSVPAQSQDLGYGITLLNGDMNGDMQRDVSDGVFLLTHLFRGGPAPVPMATCDDDPALIENGDTNGDATVDVSDAIRLFGWLYLGGAAPVEPCFEGAGAEANPAEVVIIENGFPAPRVNPCNGDLIVFGGKIIGVTRTTVQPDGGLQLIFIASWANLTGTGIPSGTEYKVLGGARIVFNFGPDASTSTAVSQERFVTAGGEPNGSVQFVIHSTRNANGDVTVDFTNVDFVCHGD